MSDELLIATLKGHSLPVNSAIFSPDGKTIVSGSGDCFIKFWDVSTKQLNAEFKAPGASVLSIAIHPNSKFLASGGGGQFSQTNPHSNSILWSVDSGQILEHEDIRGDTVRVVAFSPNGELAAFGGGSNGSTINPAAILDPVSWSIKHKVYEYPSTRVGAIVFGLAFSPDSTALAVVSEDCQIRLWNTATGELKAKWRGHSSAVNTVTFSPDGKSVVTGSLDKSVKFWDSSTFTLQKSFKPHQRSITSIAFSPDGKLMATASEDCTVKLWNTDGFSLKYTYEDHLDFVNSVAFSPDGKLLVTASDDKTVMLWQVAI